ncbi:MAG: lipoprotein [Deltaproteobacteria bacterium]|nr:MAG: lipoprotein [Deltaproteobacteria bacterium]
MRRVDTFLFSILSGLLMSCAIVTVNVYFPAEEVKEAYKSLEEEFVKPPEVKESPSSKDSSKEDDKRIGKPSRYPQEPQLSSKRIITLKRHLVVDIYTVSWAQDNIAKRITDEIRNMPEVVEAFRRRGQRVGIINKMAAQGKVGEGNNGLLVVRGSLTREELEAFRAENSDRQIIVRGMAKAILKINNLDITQENISRVLPQAAEQFAAVRREEAKPGWWVQLPDGRWVRK